jgi:hypothetical protein
VTPKFLQRAPQISAKVAKDIVAALRKGGLIDKVRRLPARRPAGPPACLPAWQKVPCEH